MSRGASVFVTALLLAWAMISSAEAEDFAPSSHVGPHARFYQDARERNLLPTHPVRPGRLARAKAASELSGEVLAFYPYWSSADPADLRYELLTTVAYFGADLGSTGEFTNMNGWPDGDLIDEAHAAGVGVALTVVNFSASSMTTLLSSALNRANAVDNIVSAVADAGADGVNIDFEGLPFAQKANFIAFLAELRTALDDALGSGHISVDMPAVDWAGAYDFDKIAEQADFLFVMAYDYHWSGGDPGPVAPLYDDGPWNYAVRWTLDDYETYIAPYDLSSVVLGLPLYGYLWPSVDGTVPGTATGAGSAVILATADSYADDPAKGPRLFDDDAQSPYLTYQSGGWYQLWYEDADSLALRFEYAKTRGTAGVGFWALGYAGSEHPMWDELDAAYTVPPGDDDDDDDTGGGCGGNAFF
ncbi:hypothetical protein KDL45_03945 [bacterium]|nr:hypothetical protein [bacterium]